MSIKLKTASIFLLVFALFAIMEYAIYRLVVFPNILNLEKNEAIKDLQRVEETLEREVYHLDKICLDWSCWDDTYNFILDNNNSYRESNLVLSTFVNENLNLLYLVDINGKVLWGKIIELNNLKEIRLNDFPPDDLSPQHPLLKHNSINSSIKGIMLTEAGPLIFTSRPIVTSEVKGPVRGACIMGHFLNSELVAAIGEQLGLNLQVSSLKKGSINSEQLRIVNSVSKSNPYYLKYLSPELLEIFAVFSDYQSHPGLLLKAQIPRNITIKARKDQILAFTLLLVSSLVLLLLILLLLNKFILNRITSLSSEISQITQFSDLVSRVQVRYDDEITLLTESTNLMLSNLANSQQELIQSEERYRFLIENAPVGIISVDREGSVINANPKLLEILGSPSLEETKKINILTFTLLVQSGITGDFLRCLNEGATLTEEKFYLSKWQKGAYLRYHLTPIRDRDRKIAGVLAIVEDIHKQKEAEQALIASEELNRGIVTNIPVGIIYFNSQGKIVYLNPIMKQFMDSINGFEANYLGMDYKEEPYFVSSGAVNIINRIFNGEVVSGEEMECLAPAGSKLVFKLYGAPRYDASGKIIGSVLMFVDITRVKELEFQFIQAQKMEALGILAGGIAHDFNNLLTSIIGNCDLAKLSLNERDPLFQDFEAISRSAHTASNLIGQLLAFSRKQVLEPKIINLNEIINDLQKMLIRLLGDNIILKTSLQSDLKLIKVNPDQIEQIILNLVINAKDAMPEGGDLGIETATIKLDESLIRTQHLTRAGWYVMLAVCDNGCGMTEEVKSRIFDPFFTTKEEGRGIGLGLASVYGIVNHSGGCIQVFSEPDKGTTFRLYFPAAEEDENTSKWNNSDQIMSEGQEKVLIVEEHSAVRSVAVRTLKRLGYKTFEAKSGSDALTLCEKMKEMVDLVIVDVIIPHINGVELVERLKVFFPQLKSLYISGYEPGSIVETGILPENAPYLKKPFRPIDLAQKVREVLDN